MSALTPISPWQLWRSHLVNCNKCIALRLKHKMCPVGILLYAKAKISGEEEPSRRPKSFPFVAKLWERIKAHIDGEWVEAVVMDRSIAAAGRMIGDYRAKTQAVIGYEVEVDNQDRHYVNARQIKPLKPKPVKAPAFVKASDILVILRREK